MTDKELVRNFAERLHHEILCETETYLGIANPLCEEIGYCFDEKGNLINVIY